MANRALPFSIEGADIGFKNFAGREGAYNKEGDRNFVVFLDPELADQLVSEGWNVKFPKPRVNEVDEDDNRRAYLPVDVSYRNIAPKIVLVGPTEPRILDESEIEMLDWLEVEQIDLTIRPYHWSVNGNEGVKAYLKDLYVTPSSESFVSKYGI